MAAGQRGAVEVQTQAEIDTNQPPHPVKTSESFQSRGEVVTLIPFPGSAASDAEQSRYPVRNAVMAEGRMGRLARETQNLSVPQPLCE